MRDAYRLTFHLPPILALRVKSGRHNPCLHGCLLTVDRGVVSIEGPSRQQVFEQARRFFRVEAKKLDPFTISAVLVSPRDEALGMPSGSDGYSIIVGSDVTIAATRVEPNISAARPPLKIVSAG